MGEATGQVVVVGVDFEAGGDQAMVAALRLLASGTARKVHLIHVLDPRDVIGSMETPALETEEQVLAQAPGTLHERIAALSAQEGLPYSRERVATHARLGRAVPTLLQMAVDYDADLIVVGTHGRRGVERAMLGSVAEELVRKASCPVLVARPKDYTGLERTPRPDAAPTRPLPPKTRSIDPTEHTVSTEADGWNPSPGLPTGFRIV